MSLYTQLFGRKSDAGEGDVISMSEHGRVGGVSTGQPFKFTSIIDQTTGTPNPLPTGASTSANQTTLNSIVATNDKTHLLLQQIRDAIAMRPDYVEATNTQAVSGQVTLPTTQDLRTIATVTTLTGQTNIGGFSADMMVENSSYQDWGLSIRSLLI